MKLSIFFFISVACSFSLFALSSTTHALSSLESKGVTTIRSANVDTDPPARRRKLNATDLRLWLSILPDAQDRRHDEYLVFPGLGIVTPLIYTPTTDPRYKDIVEGRNLDVNEFLKQGVHHYPGTSLPGFEGNALIGGHSNFFKNQKTDFTSVFATLPMLDSGDEVWYYRRVNDQSWMRYVYTVTRSYETKPDDAAVFDAIGTGSELTFYTCVPIGTADNRWIIRAKLDMSQQVFYPTMVESYDNMSGYQNLDQEAKDKLSILVQSGANNSQIQAFIDSGNVQESSGAMADTGVIEIPLVAPPVVAEPVISWRQRVINRFIGLFS